jgi:hypothetical protein
MAMSENLTQTRIPGTFDEPNVNVQEAAEEYVTLLTGRMKMQERENVAREKLLEVMRDNDIEECEVAGYSVKRTHTETERIKIKKLVSDNPVEAANA